MIVNQQYKIDFIEDGHIYFVNGEVKPSVTQILAPLSNYDKVPADILKKAQERGTRLHLLCHRFVTGQPQIFPIDEEDLVILRGLDEWYTGKFIFEKSYSEIQLYCPRLDICGTPDLFFDEGELYDFKFGAWGEQSAGPQTAAYAEMIENVTGIKIKRRYVLAPNSKGKFQSYLLNNRSDIGVFKQLNDKYMRE